jgi:hypothetical protein
MVLSIQRDGLSGLLSGAIMSALGLVLALASRKSDTRLVCSHCGLEVRDAEDRACLGCLTLFDDSKSGSGGAAVARDPRPLAEKAEPGGASSRVAPAKTPTLRLKTSSVTR